MARLGGAEAITALARLHGAFQRPRGVKSAEDLLRLMLAWPDAFRDTDGAWLVPSMTKVTMPTGVPALPPLRLLTVAVNVTG